MSTDADTLAELVADPSRLEDLAEEDLPEVLAALERLKAKVWARLARPPERNAPPDRTAQEDRLMDVEEVAEILNVDSRYVYDHADDWPFTRKISHRKLRFSEDGLYRWLDTRT